MAVSSRSGCVYQSPSSRMDGTGGLWARLNTTREGVRPRARGCMTHARCFMGCLLDRCLVITRQWVEGDTRETGLLRSCPHTSTCVPQVLQASHDRERAFFVHRDVEQLVPFPHGPVTGVTIFRDVQHGGPPCRVGRGGWPRPGFCAGARV